MVATDTVVGVVGALVLIAVMVGVFAYEYNQSDAGPDGDDPRLAQFQERYGFLDPAQDIDGDGTANLDDDDLDGDGTNNTDDADVVVEETLTGSLGAAGQNNLVLGFTVGAGCQGVVAEATYGILTPPPLPPQPSLTATLAAGNQTQEGVTTVSGMEATSVAALSGPVEAGEGAFTLSTDATNAAPADAALRVLITYA